MKVRGTIAVLTLLGGPALLGAADVPAAPPQQLETANPAISPTEGMSRESSRRADERYDAMLTKMQAAVEEIAQLYGNPTFLQVFTNDPERADELKQRLRAARTRHDIQIELESLEKRRSELLSDIALKERESSTLFARLARQRRALDGVSAAIELATKAVEETAR